MATVSNATLTITPASDTKVNVRVQGSVNFSASDINAAHRLSIDLYPVQASGDKPTDADLIGAGPLYSFLWGVLLQKKPYKTLTPQSAGAQAFDETREVDSAKLDEDPGKVNLAPSGFPPQYVPKQDEIKAVVSIARVHSLDSNVAETGGFID
jgi:hypothetical protein